MYGWLKNLWRDEHGDTVENLGVMLIIALGIGSLVAGFSVILNRSGANFEKFIEGVVRP